MIDATILIPTYRHAALVPYSVRSALAQESVEIEVFVVGDGVENDTRAALGPFLEDPRVRFFDLPKGQRHGELHRHRALQEASGRIVCYLSDDDLLLRSHVAEMGRLLEDADFAHSAPLWPKLDGSFFYGPVDMSRPEFHALISRGGWNYISLSGAAHTLDAYHRLPHGWRPAPPGVWTDLNMWQQFVQLQGFRGRTATRLTHIHLPDPDRRELPMARRVAELEGWWDRIQDPGFEDELERIVADCVREGAETREVWVCELQAALTEIGRTRWWRLRTWIATLPPVRALRGPR